MRGGVETVDLKPKTGQFRSADRGECLRALDGGLQHAEPGRSEGSQSAGEFLAGLRDIEAVVVRARGLRLERRLRELVGSDAEGGADSTSVELESGVTARKVAGRVLRVVS